MFLAVDESKNETKRILGLIAMPKDLVPEFEKNFCALRLETKTMGEIGWQCVSKTYVDKYKRFLDLFLNDPELTFHAITYSAHRKFRAAYSLIRVTSLKLWKEGHHHERELFILFDEDSEAFPRPDKDIIRTMTGQAVLEFENSYDAIKKIAARDQTFRHRISFCNQGASHQLGLLQITDILTGAMSAIVNKRENLSNEHADLIQYIRDGIKHEFDASRATVYAPSLKSFKIHFLDPIAHEQSR